MTNKEAIITLKANYPDSCYEQLREAVDAAIEALKAQDAAGDTISRKAAIRVASGYCHPANIAKELAKLPPSQPDVIRCKDCKHQVKEWRTDKRLKDNGYYACGCDVVGDACGYWALLGQDDDYCSMAERRTDVNANT